MAGLSSDPAGASWALKLAEMNVLPEDTQLDFVVYHSTLGLLLATTKKRQLLVLARDTLKLLKCYNLSGKADVPVQCLALRYGDGIVLSNRSVICYRKAIGSDGTLLLGSVLQMAYTAGDEIALEMTTEEAQLIVDAARNVGVDDNQEYMQTIRENLKSSEDPTMAKWTSVVVTAPYATHESVLKELKCKLLQNREWANCLPAVAAVAHRLFSLAVPDVHPMHSDAPGAAPAASDYARSIATNMKAYAKQKKMRNEANRLATFDGWPHEYQLATPENLARVGFYSDASTDAPAVTVCFCCGLRLLNWKSEDEPWSEHNKFSSNCPMVTNEPSGNEPMLQDVELEHDLIAVGTYDHNALLATYSSRTNTVSLFRGLSLKKYVELEVCDFDEIIWEAILDSTGEKPSGKHVVSCQATALALCDVPSDGKSSVVEPGDGKSSIVEPGVVCGAVVTRECNRRSLCVISFGWTPAPDEWDADGFLQTAMNDSASSVSEAAFNPLEEYDPNDPFGFIERSYDWTPGKLPSRKKAPARPMRSNVVKCIPIDVKAEELSSWAVTHIQSSPQREHIVIVVSSIMKESSEALPSSKCPATNENNKSQKSLVLCYRCQSVKTNANLEEFHAPLIDGYASTIILKDVPERNVWSPVANGATSLDLPYNLASISMLRDSSELLGTFRFAAVTADNKIVLVSGPDLTFVACFEGLGNISPYSLACSTDGMLVCCCNNNYVMSYRAVQTRTEPAKET